MVKSTFTNLPKERQEEILLMAYEEFALKGYNSASLSDIIKKLNLAKGSFYRYFASKKNLYAYLIEDAKSRRLSKLGNLIANPDIDFFDLIKQNFIDKVQFDMEHPIIGGFLMSVLYERDNNEISDIIWQLFEQTIEQTQQIICHPKFAHQLSISDPVIIAFQIFNMQLWLYDYVAYKYKIDYRQIFKSRNPITKLSAAQIDEVITTAVNILRNGIQLT